MFCFSIIITIGSPFAFLAIIWKNRDRLEEDSIKHKWGMLFETLRVYKSHQIYPESRNSHFKLTNSINTHHSCENKSILSPET